MLVKPCGQAEFIPQFKIGAAVRSYRRSNPVRVFLQCGTLYVHVIGHVVQDHAHVVMVCFIQQVPEYSVIPETVIHPGDKQRPVSVIPAEPGFGIVYLSPGVIRILGNGRQPNGIDPQFTEKAVVDLVGHAFQVTRNNLLWDVLQRTESLVVGGFVTEPVHKPGTRYGCVCLNVLPGLSVPQAFLCQGDQQVIGMTKSFMAYT